MGLRISFFVIFRSPGEGFGAPFGPFGLPWGDLGFHFADLGPHFAAQSGHKRRKKNVSSAHRVPEAILGAKREGPGPSKCDENIAPAGVLAKGHSRHFGSQK